MDTPFDFTAADFSPQVLRLLQLAKVECSAARNGRGDRINEEHILIAMRQDDDPSSLSYELFHNAGVTVADLRAGNVKGKQP